MRRPSLRQAAASAKRAFRGVGSAIAGFATLDGRLRRIEDAWRARLPAFLNATVSVAAQGVELRRLKDRIENWETTMTHAGAGGASAAAVAARPPISVPAILRPVHVEGARLFADRESALAALPRGGVVAEIGVAFGDFSAAMLEALAPRRFDAFDLFGLHHEKQVMGRPSADVFGALSHRAFYERRFADAIAREQVHVFEGDSSDQLSRRPDASYDVIYIDGQHTYEGVLKDAETAALKIKPDGILVFNDYIMHDYWQDAAYGVVHVVNEFCVNRGWRFVYMALHAGMFCDVALMRAPLAQTRP